MAAYTRRSAKERDESVRYRAYAVLFGIVLFLFTGYVLADTFLIRHVYSAVPAEIAVRPSGQTVTVRPATAVPRATEQAVMTPSPAPADETLAPAAAGETPGPEPAGETASPEPVIDEPTVTDTSYKDRNITVEINTHRYMDTTIYVADVWLSGPEYLKTALAKNAYGLNVTEKPTKMASAAKAVLAINGDFYGARRNGYVIRNGVLYRKDRRDCDDLVIYADGSLGVINEKMVTAEEMLASGAWNVFSFGPAVIKNGEIDAFERDGIEHAMTVNPRTAIGEIEDLHYVFLATDGRISGNRGLTMHELAVFMQSLGVRTGYNLDGGGSSAMVFMGKMLNRHSLNAKADSERSVSDIVYIG